MFAIWDLWRRGETQTFMSFMVLLNTSAQFIILPGPMWGGKEAQALLKLLETELERAAVICWFPQLGCFPNIGSYMREEATLGLEPSCGGSNCGREKVCPRFRVPSSLSSSSVLFPAVIPRSVISSCGYYCSPRCVLIGELGCVLEGEKILEFNW